MSTSRRTSGNDWRNGSQKSVISESAPRISLIGCEHFQMTSLLKAFLTIAGTWLDSAWFIRCQYSQTADLFFWFLAFQSDIGVLSMVDLALDSVRIAFEVQTNVRSST